MLPGEERGREPDSAEDDLRQRGPAIAEEAVEHDRAGRARRVDVEPGRGDEAADEPERRDARAEPPPQRCGHEHGAEERDARSREKREDRREREPVDTRRVDHGTTLDWAGWFGHRPTNEWWLTAAGHADRNT